MKKLILLTLLVLLTAVSPLYAWSVFTPPLVIEEVDGNPSLGTTTKLIVPNGTLSVSGSEATLTFGVGSGDLMADGSVPLTADWDAGAFEIRARTFESDVVSGTAPLTVASTTVVTNFNADLLDGYNSTNFVRDVDFTVDGGVLVGTGAGTFAEETGDTLRTSLGLAIGTNVQAYDATIAKTGDNEIITGTWTIQDLITGTLSITEDSGLIKLVDMAVSDTPADGTVMGYTFELDDITMLTIQGKADHAGSVDELEIVASVLFRSAVAAGSPVMEFIATTDTPSSSPETNAEQGWMEVDVAGTPYYIPYYN